MPLRRLGGRQAAAVKPVFGLGAANSPTGEQEVDRHVLQGMTILANTLILLHRLTKFLTHKPRLL